MNDASLAIDLSKVTKRFGATVALDGASFSVKRGAVHALPDRFRAWVRPGGRLFAIVGDSPAMQAILYTRADAAHWRQESLFETDVAYLKNAEPPRRFAL